MRPLGSSLQQHVAQAVAAAAGGPKQQDAGVEAMIRHCLGPVPRPAMSWEAEAKLLGSSRRRIPEAGDALAAA
eukprot:12980516-Alexandrium_andersonii.AAC.1